MGLSCQCQGRLPLPRHGFFLRPSTGVCHVIIFNPPNRKISNSLSPSNVEKLHIFHNYDIYYEVLHTLKNSHILPTEQWYAPSAVINVPWYCMVLHGIAWYCMVLHCIAWYCMVLHDIAWYCMVLHGIAWFCTVLHGTTWYCMVLHGIACYCMLLHCFGIEWYYVVLHSIAWYSMVLNGIAWYYMVLHGIAWNFMVLNGIAGYCMVLQTICISLVRLRLGHRWDMLTELPSGERVQKIYLFTTIYLFILYYYLFIYSSLDLGLSWTPLGHIDRTTNRRKEVKGKVPVLDQFDLFPLFQKYIWQL